MDKKRRLARPGWGNLERSLEQSLRNFLPPSLSVSLRELPEKQSRTEDCRMLKVRLEGAPLAKLCAEFGEDGKLDLHWLLPAKPGAFTDATTGELWVSARILPLESLSQRTDQDGTAAGIESIPDLDQGGLTEGWWTDAERLWGQFARAVEDDKVHLEDFIRLEAGLNALWTSARKRVRLLTPTGDVSKENPLLRIERQRQIRIGLWGVESHGRLRLPHKSHRGRLCPFQTPESKRTGLDLHLAAGAEITDDGTIRPGDYLFSIAVGMIPYPFHTDGPRLMMGGKNMKQAETGIAGAEPPIVPGYLEGERSQFIPPLKGSLNEKNRLTPSIGLNALTVVMPFEGYTYEDGLVVSQSLARRFFIKDGTHTIQKAYERWLREPGPETLDPIEAVRATIPTVPPRFVYGDSLPLPQLPFYEQDEDGALKPCPLPAVFYDHHAPGELENAGPQVDAVAFRPAGKDEGRGIRLKLTLKWSFRVERPLGLGDKLTGRHGNKGVVTRILPDEDMPKVRMGKEEFTAELIISPSSIMGRKNLGQIWEMAHSVLLKQNVQGISDGDELEDPQKRDLLRLMRCAGADEWGAFPTLLRGRELREVRAFAGWQYFCRLHHHAVKKLQARGASGPYQEATGQPAICGSRTGQRLGEMENWSLLSHGAEDVFFRMRANFTGNFSRTKDLMRRIYRSLNLELAEGSPSEEGERLGPGRNDLLIVERPSKAADGVLDLRDFLKRDFRFRPPLKNEERLSVRYRSGRKNVSMKEELNRLLESLKKRLKNASPEAAMGEAIGKKKRIGDLGKLAAMLDCEGNLPVEPELLRLFPDLKASLSQFLHSTNDEDRLSALVRYRTQLIRLLAGKEGVPRRHLLGRRYNHSGRAVIVPCPDLPPHEVRLPLALLAELLEGYGDGIFNDIFSESLSTVRARVNDPLRKKWNDAEAKRCDQKLRDAQHELWGFLVRQPSLHRHSIQAFRLRCWNEPVIGLPPFVTAGFNADFDGDTMAVFLPPPGSGSLEHFSVIRNPGLVGTGAPALASGLDLALGWWNLDETARKKLLARVAPEEAAHRADKKLGDCLPLFLRGGASLGFEEFGALLAALQGAVCAASTGSATLTPLEFERLSQHLDAIAIPRQKGNEEAAESSIREFLGSHADLGLARMVASGAKGKAEDVRQMTWAIGEIGNGNVEDVPEKPYIKGNFWHGLTEDEMFLYSYPSRDSMAQKKLAVAEAGYLSRQFAEGLYELRVRGRDCGTPHGLRVGYVKGQEEERLTLSIGAEKFGGEKLVLPTLGRIEQDLERMAWGRFLAGEGQSTRCLNTNDLQSVLAFWRDGTASDRALQSHLQANEGCLLLRSPLFCACASNEEVCARCCGADPSQKPLDAPEPIEAGAFVGLTAAQAIGERGTQLAMKRFHDVSGSTEKSKIAQLRKLFIAKPSGTASLHERLGDLLKELTAGEGGGQDGAQCPEGKKGRAFAELPQAMIHYELALRRSDPFGLDAEASRSEGRYLSALAHERILPLLHLDTGSARFTDHFETVKSRLLWDKVAPDSDGIPLEEHCFHRPNGKGGQEDASTDF